MTSNVSAPDSLDPGALMVAVEEGSERLEAAADQLHDAVVQFEKARALYERDVELEKIKIYDEHKRLGERLPAEDIRNALAHAAIDDELYANFLEAKARREALQVRYRALADSISARQSLLKALQGG